MSFCPFSTWCMFGRGGRRKDKKTKSPFLTWCMFGVGGGEEAPLNFSPINSPRYSPCHPSITRLCCTPPTCTPCTPCAPCTPTSCAALKANWRVTNSQSLSRLGSSTAPSTPLAPVEARQALTFGANGIDDICTQIQIRIQLHLQSNTNTTTKENT